MTHKATPEGIALLEEWQNRLGLTEWRIMLSDKMNPADMMMEGVAGCTEWTECNKTARIEIEDPEEYGERIVSFDYEKTLVHELLHLKLSLLSDDVPELQARVAHQLIDDLARAFVDAKRFGQILVGTVESNNRLANAIDDMFDSAEAITQGIKTQGITKGAD